MKSRFSTRSPWKLTKKILRIILEDKTDNLSEND